MGKNRGSEGKWKSLYERERQARITAEKRSKVVAAIATRRRSQRDKLAMGLVGALIICALLIGRALSRDKPAVIAQTSQQVQDQYTPDYVLASVHVQNGNGRCSGTIISQGEQWAAGVAAAHCYAGRIGGNFTVWYPDGSSSQATLLAIDRDIDVALFKVPAEEIMSHSWVPPRNQIPKAGQYTAVGYTGGRGPIYKEIDWNSSYGDNWRFSVRSGTFGGGDSGGGIFKNGALISVIFGASDRNLMWGCNHPQLVSFLERSENLLQGCGPWGCPPGNGYDRGRPPGWRPSPNVPINPKPPSPDDQQPEPDTEGLDELKEALDELKEGDEDLWEQIDRFNSRLGELAEHDHPPPDLSGVEKQISNLESRLAERDTMLGEQFNRINSRIDRLALQPDVHPELPYIPSERDIEEIAREAIEARLRDLALPVVFEAGDDPDEPERREEVPIIGGTLVIPPQQLRTRNVDPLGQQIGEALYESAPLGKPLKVRNVLQPK